jgi:hypothetical protein
MISTLEFLILVVRASAKIICFDRVVLYGNAGGGFGPAKFQNPTASGTRPSTRDRKARFQTGNGFF